MVIDGLKGNDVDLVSLDHCEEVPSHLTDLDPAAQNYDSCLVTVDTGGWYNIIQIMSNVTGFHITCPAI